MAGARAVAVKWNLPEGKKRQKLKLKNTRHATSLSKNFMSHGEEGGNNKGSGKSYDRDTKMTI